MTFQAPFGHRTKYPFYACEGLGEEFCIAAYRPLGAANIAASYTATNPGATPAWSAAAGWICSATSYIVTGVNLAGAINLRYGYSILMRYSDLVLTGGDCLFGATPSLVLGNNTPFYVIYDGKVGYWAENCSDGIQFLPLNVLGVVIVTPTEVFFDGVSLGLLGVGPSGVGNNYRDGGLCLGARGNATGVIDMKTTVNIQAVAIYSGDIAPFVAKLTAQAQALT
jgi:hypothetical protein